MRPVLSITTAIAFLLHVWLGCCTHHVHASELGSACASTHHKCHSHSDNDSHEHSGHDHSGGEPTKDDCPSKGCDGQQCTFGVISGKSLSKAWFASVALLPMAAPELSQPQLIFSQSTLGFDLVHHQHERVHLLHQVFLI